MDQFIRAVLGISPSSGVTFNENEWIDFCEFNKGLINHNFNVFFENANGVSDAYIYHGSLYDFDKIDLNEVKNIPKIQLKILV
jgi:hypothetical protein